MIINANIRNDTGKIVSGKKPIKLIIREVITSSQYHNVELEKGDYIEVL